MNKERRRSINNIKANIARLKKEITDLSSELSIVLDQEQDAFDNMPEGLQSSIDKQKDLSLKWRGSKNQRVIDMNQTCIQNKIILYCN